jgi:hypothetical protein
MTLKNLAFFLAILVCVACGDNQTKVKNTSTADQASASTEENSSESDIKTLDEKIQIIKDNFAKIENGLASFQKREKKENEYGGILEKVAYFDQSVPQKVKLGNYGEHGSIVRTFYLKDNKLFFVFEQEFSEASLRGPFTTKEKRYYIFDDELIRVLEKEKTSKSSTHDMTKVANVDVTDQWTSKQNIISEFTTILRETATSLVVPKTVGLENARWISTDDPKSGVEIKDGKFIMFYEGVKIEPSNIYDYELYEKEGVEYLRLKNATDTFSYGLLEYTSENMVLSHLGRGNTLSYRKEK